MLFLAGELSVDVLAAATSLSQIGLLLKGSKKCNTPEEVL
jgi:hypothetical protein